jgi:hypothetical protein
MLKVYYRNRFRIRNLDTGKVERLNLTVNSKGNDQWIEGFDTYKEAFTEMKRLLTFKPHYRLKVETYSTNQSIQKDITNKRVHRKVEQARLFSGKGLKENVSINKKDERKYSPDKYYTPEIRLAQSAFFNKGLSLVSRMKDKKSHTQTGVDYLTVEKVAKLHDHGSFTLGFCIVDALRKRLDQFPNRKSIKDYLKTRGYSAAQQRRIVEQVYNPNL